MHNDSPAQPWYKEFWPWFLIIILGVAIIMSLHLVYIAVVGGDTLVVSNYYDAGKGINQSLDREKLADNLALHGELTIDNSTGVAELLLQGNSRPPLLTLNLISPTQAEMDRRVILQPVDSNVYRGTLPDAVTGRRFVEILGMQDGKEWRMFDEEELASGQVILLGN